MTESRPVDEPTYQVGDRVASAFDGELGDIIAIGSGRFPYLVRWENIGEEACLYHEIEAA